MGISRFLLCAAVFGISALLCGCSGDDSGGSSGPIQPSVSLAGADVLVDGQSVANLTIAAGSGSSTLFTATLADPADRDRIHQMQMEYPDHSSGGMMDHRSTMLLHDDGTHGDPVAGDGTYCYLDTDGHIGPHGDGCPDGEYTYRFHGDDTSGHETNWVDCRVTVQ